jgi:hypothetical protein
MKHPRRITVTMRLATITALSTAVLFAGCASGPPPTSPATQMRTLAPVNYETTVTDYFDLMLPGPQTGRKLSIGAPESSPCGLRGGGGRYMGWVVPVIYDTSPPQGNPLPTATPANSGNAKKPAAGSAASKASASSAASKASAGSSASNAAANAPATVALQEVSVSGARYFFWFSSETLSGVTRRADLCP